jgi:hypothetical protein
MLNIIRNIIKNEKNIKVMNDLCKSLTLPELFREIINIK